jgi:hypothetical protein
MKRVIKWIRLLDETPSRKGTYFCIALNYHNAFDTVELLWMGDSGFQPLDFNKSPKSHPLNMNVTHWLYYHIPLDILTPLREAESLRIQTEVFFDQNGLKTFAHNENIEIFAMYGNAIEFIITDIDEAVLKVMREKFKSNGTHWNVRKTI